jgi:hypothetical protein
MLEVVGAIYGEMIMLLIVESRTWEVSWGNFFFCDGAASQKNVSSHLGRSVAIFHFRARKFGCVIP